MNLALETTNQALEVAERIERGEFAGAANIRATLEHIPNARHLVLAAAFRCLGARKWYYEKGSSEKKFEPDYRTQLDAVKFLASYQDGLPVQTTLAVNVGDRPGDQSSLSLEEAVKRSPALRDRLQKLLEPT